MDNQNLAIKIKDLRNRRGFSQEQLSEESKLSLRTIQRIEKGESIPKGDTLVKLTQALNVTPDDLLDWEIIEDKGYVQLLNWSSLGFIIQPLLGIIIPLVMWILKRNKIKGVDDTGKKIINFQITWILMLYLISTSLMLIFDRELYLPNIDLQNIVFLLSDYSKYAAIIFTLYLFNMTMVLFNIRKTQKGLKNRYIPAIPFLK